MYCLCHLMSRSAGQPKPPGMKSLTLCAIIAGHDLSNHNNCCRLFVRTAVKLPLRRKHGCGVRHLNMIRQTCRCEESFFDGMFLKVMGPLPDPSARQTYDQQYRIRNNSYRRKDRRYFHEPVRIRTQKHIHEPRPERAVLPAHLRGLRLQRHHQHAARAQEVRPARRVFTVRRLRRGTQLAGSLRGAAIAHTGDQSQPLLRPGATGQRRRLHC